MTSSSPSIFSSYLLPSIFLHSHHHLFAFFPCSVLRSIFLRSHRPLFTLLHPSSFSFSFRGVRGLCGFLCSGHRAKHLLHCSLRCQLMGIQSQSVIYAAIAKLIPPFFIFQRSVVCHDTQRRRQVNSWCGVDSRGGMGLG